MRYPHSRSRDVINDTWCEQTLHAEEIASVRIKKEWGCVVQYWELATNDNAATLKIME